MNRIFLPAAVSIAMLTACANSAPPHGSAAARDGTMGSAAIATPAPESGAGVGAAKATNAAATSHGSSAPSAAASTGAAASADSTASTNTPPSEASSLCPADMVAVRGSYCTKLERKCLRRRKRRQCAEYEADSRCRGREVAMALCMDRYEWPNEKGRLPKVMNTWKDARKSCAEVGKRLCTEDEWTLACEGPERLGFPYGNVRDSSACPFDKPSPRVNERRLYYSRTQAAELARLDQRDPSGSYERCVSPYGVRDMTGSVDEWVYYPPGRPYRSSLKGGNWGEYRNACRPVTRGHGENWRYYQTGFRCCKDIEE